MNCKHRNFGHPKTKIGTHKDGKRIYCADENVVLFTTQRAASTSMHETLAPADSNNFNRYVEPDEAIGLILGGALGLMFIRHPFDRFASAYDIFGKRFCCAESFTDYVLNNYNPHWSPIMQVHVYDDEIMERIYMYTFESLEQHWKRWFYNWPLQSRNRSFQRSRHIEGKKVKRGRLSWDQLRDQLKASTVSALVKYYHEDLMAHDEAYIRQNVEEVRYA